MPAFCPRCGQGLRSGAKFCSSCGRPTINTLPATESIIYVKCTFPECGVDNPEIANFCLNCGHPIRSNLPLSKGNILQQRYEIVEEIGRGGQSRIYLAKDRRLNEREVAVKELLTGSLDDTHRTSITRRFHKEASTLANLKHIHLPIILDFFSTDRGEYLVMEYIEGKTLQSLSEETTIPFSESQILHWAGQLCKVLDYLHANSIIFQDLKPDNIMLDNNEIVKLIDFNIAKVFQEGRRKADTIQAL